MKYAVVCTNYNNSHFTSLLVDSLEAGAFPPERIVVVDNASHPDAVESLREIAGRSSRVDLVLNRNNDGYFKGLNAGLERLAASGSDLDFVFVGNNDLEFPSDFGVILQRHAQEWGQLPVLSPSIVTLDGEHQNPHVVKGISRARQLIYDAYYSNYYASIVIKKLAHLTRSFTDRKDERQYEIAQFVHQGYGAGYVLSRKFLTEFGLLWAPGMLGGEEYFLSRQLEERGLQVYYDPRLQVTHHCKGATGNVPSRKLWEMWREAHHIYRRHVKAWA